MKKLLLGLTIIIFVASFSFAATFETIQVKNGETLDTIAQKYLKSANMAKALLQYNGLNSARDVVAGMNLKVPYSLSNKRVASVSFKVGNVEYKDGSAWKPVALNQILIQSDVVRTLEGSKANITLDDSTVVKLGPSSTLSLANYAYNQRSRNTNLQLSNGSAALNVTTLTRGSNFNVSSVTAVAGVRGTKFYMGVNDNNDVDLSVYQGSVEITSNAKSSTPTSNVVAAASSEPASSAQPVIVNSGYATRVSASGSVEKPFPIPGKIEWADEN